MKHVFYIEISQTFKNQYLLDDDSVKRISLEGSILGRPRPWVTHLFLKQCSMIQLINPKNLLGLCIHKPYNHVELSIDGIKSLCRCAHYIKEFKSTNEKLRISYF